MMRYNIVPNPKQLSKTRKDLKHRMAAKHVCFKLSKL